MCVKAGTRCDTANIVFHARARSSDFTQPNRPGSGGAHNRHDLGNRHDDFCPLLVEDDMVTAYDPKSPRHRIAVQPGFDDDITTGNLELEKTGPQRTNTAWVHAHATGRLRTCDTDQHPVRVGIDQQAGLGAQGHHVAGRMHDPTVIPVAARVENDRITALHEAGGHVTDGALAQVQECGSRLCFLDCLAGLESSPADTVGIEPARDGVEVVHSGPACYPVPTAASLPHHQTHGTDPLPVTGQATGH